MGKLGYWLCGFSWFAVRHCHYLCEIGDWAWNYGKGKGDGLEVVANPAFAAISADAETEKSLSWY